MTEFEQDLKQDMSINGGASSKGMYNLVVSKRDLGLWKIGMKPNRHWKVSDVKKYFGLKGSKEKIYDDICKMVEEHKVFKPKPMGKEEFIEKYFYPELTESEISEHQQGDIDWKDEYLLECAEKCNVDLELYEALT
tara:strand:+ start:34 stop:441 length:408 start_codon:yes stop_codon:yes gene_type:complete